MLTNEKQVVLAARRLSGLNAKILSALRGPVAGLAHFMLAECEFNDLVRRRDRLLAQVEAYDAEHNVGRVGHWQVTAGGTRFWPDDPRPGEVHVEDVAHHLSMLCRYCGAVRRFFSVAHHSVLVSRIVSPEAALAGLLHDAAEAYLGDVISPVKSKLPAFHEAEARIMLAVCERFGLDGSDEALWAEVKRGDEVLLATEFRDLAYPNVRYAEPREPPMAERIGRTWGTARGEREFLSRFQELCHGRGA